MSAESLTLKTKVLPGHRIECIVPQAPEGVEVQVTVAPLRDYNGAAVMKSIVSFLESLPQGPRAYANWEEYEEHLRLEKEAWER